MIYSKKNIRLSKAKHYDLCLAVLYHLPREDVELSKLPGLFVFVSPLPPIVIPIFALSRMIP